MKRSTNRLLIALAAVSALAVAGSATAQSMDHGPGAGGYGDHGQPGERDAGYNGGQAMDHGHDGGRDGQAMDHGHDGGYGGGHDGGYGHDHHDMGRHYGSRHHHWHHHHHHWR